MTDTTAWRATADALDATAESTGYNVNALQLAAQGIRQLCDEIDRLRALVPCSWEKCPECGRGG